MNKRGFTLVELLAVIVVLGIVISIAVPTTMNLINNSKKKAFVHDARAYINAARYSVLSENGKKTFFKLDELYVKNSKSYYQGVVYAKKDGSGHYKYSIFIYDTKTSNVLGQTYFDKLMLLNEDELSVSKIKKFDSERFGTILITNLENDYEIKTITKDNESVTITINEDGSISENMHPIKVGALVYLKHNSSQNQEKCIPYRVINDSDDSISLFDSNTYTNRIDDIKTADGYSDANSYFLNSYSTKLRIDEGNLYIRLLTINDLYYYLDYEKNGLTQKLLTENKDKIAELFRPSYPDGFYYSEWKNSTHPRFISLGTYGDDDYCRANGSYISTEANEKICYAFSLNDVYHGGKLDGSAKITKHAVNDYLSFNNIIELKNYYSYAYKDEDCNELYSTTAQNSDKDKVIQDE